ncbi:MAG: M20/M25/M40 family metallo-hydrolase [Lachnospiraceae bacterium]|nr:M20/M25/M40 family metallo-hydrolase [Lachnospiraceae bacterium]
MLRFMRYADCASESHNEKAFCELMEQELSNLGIPFERQELSSQVVTDGWNILARVPGKADKKPFLFVFHLDTVAPGNFVETCIEDGRIKSRGNSILGADGKLAIAVVMEAVSRLLAAGEMNRPVEMLFTVCQELGLHGGKYADYSRIESEEAVVIDHYVTGEVLIRTPSRLYLNVELIGHEAHVIRDAELGVNALKAAVEIIHQIPTGRITENQSINIFDLVSLSPSNAVPKYARFDVEIRSFGEAIRKEAKEKIHRIVTDTAERMGCRCNIREELDVPEADFSENTDLLERMAAIYEKTGIPMKLARSFGVLDATCTNQLGIRTVPIGLNIYHSHSAREYVVVDEMKKMLELAENIIRYF